MKHTGTVYLVGAGPGDAGLMTLRGAELLARADVVVHDALINADFLGLAPPSAEIIYAGKRYGQHAVPQEVINRLLVDKARARGVSFAVRGNLIVLAPPLVITEKELDGALQLLDTLLTDMEEV